LLRLHWRRALRWRWHYRPSEEALHLLLAGGVGLIGGLVNVVFYYAIHGSALLFLHDARDPVEVAERLSGWHRLLVPALGGLLAGLVLHWGLRVVGPQGTSNVVEAVLAGDGRLPLRTALIKAASSIVSIGTGASIGREGGITQLAATLASKWGQFSGWEPYRLRLLVGCGAAAGIAAAYNAPIGGAVFAATIVLGNFSMNIFVPLVFASVIAAVVSRTFFGIQPWYVVPDFNFTRLSQLPWFVLLGLVCGGYGALFLNLLKSGERLCARLPLPLWGRLTLGGVLVGLIAIQHPQVWGNGYRVTNRILHEDFSNALPALEFLATLFVAKLLATVAAVSSGTVGGAFTPTLFLGASLGSLFGTTLHVLGQAQGLPVAAFGVVGMASMLAATTHSPLLAMILVFEISLNYSIMPPLMLGCSLAALLSRRLQPRSIYTAPVRAQGLGLSHESARPGVSVERKVGDLMHDPVAPLDQTTPLSEIAARFLSSPNNFLPVVNERQQLMGVVALQDMKPYLQEEQALGVIAHDVMRPPPPCLVPSQSLLEALPTVLASELRNVLVVSSAEERKLVGALVRAEVLGLLADELAPGGNPTPPEGPELCEGRRNAPPF
jgi:CIC family chloride channel protein